MAEGNRNHPVGKEQTVVTFKKKLRIVVDILMTVLFLAVMAYHITETGFMNGLEQCF